MLLSTFLDSVSNKKSFENNGIYIVSVDLPQYEGLYKVGMADVGSLATRLGNFQTFFFPIRTKVVIHLLANKPNGRRNSSSSHKDMITSSRYAEQTLHGTITEAGWDNTGTGEWFKAPRPPPKQSKQTVEDLIAMAKLHHFGDKSKNMKSDGGTCKFCIMKPHTIEKVPRPKACMQDPPDAVELEPIREGTRDIAPTLDINGNLRINYRKLKVIRVDE